MTNTTSIILTNWASYPPPVTTTQIDGCWGVSTKSARDIVSKYRGRVIVP